MIQVIEFDLQKILPVKNEVLRSQGVPDSVLVPGRIQEIADKSIENFEQTAHPIGMLSVLSAEEFGVIFEGEGRNADDALLADIYPHGEKLGLFALTMGDDVSREIENLFQESEFVEATMLDSVASLAAEAAVDVLENDFLETMSTLEDTSPGYCTISYSPGYCGWSITAQRKIFDFLDPGQIGITLNDSSLMTPLKSVTGVLIFGRREIHFFEPMFSYCTACTHRSCMDRLKKLKLGKTLDI
ncbi:MAG: hypothetical protein H8D05_00060 [FCB group bacterium]|nr:hypothetical protein [FCB group bacterium]